MLAASLAVLTICGQVHASYVYLFALAGGFVFVVDSPARQVFVNELVPADSVRNAIGLNAAVFQSTRLIGPALAGVLISSVGAGWVFAANALCYLVPIIALLRIRPASWCRVRCSLGRRPAARDPALRRRPAAPGLDDPAGSVVGTFGLNFPIVLTGIAATPSTARRPSTACSTSCWLSARSAER